jgi:hypothetical protein
MILHLGEQDMPLAQMGPDFIILKQALNRSLPAASGSISLKIDEREKTFPVTFPQGIPAGQRRVALAEAAAEVAAA